MTTAQACRLLECTRYGLAKRLGISQPAVHQWNPRKIPQHRADEILALHDADQRAKADEARRFLASVPF